MDEKHLIRALATGRGNNPQRTWRCPDEGEIAAYADASLDEAATRRMEEHLSGCDFCMDQVSFLVGVGEAEVPTDVPKALLAKACELAGSEEGTPWRLVLRWALVGGFAASLVVAAGLWLREPQVVISPAPPAAPPLLETMPSPPARNEAHPTPLPAPTIRNGARPVILPNLLSPQEGTVIRSEELELRWREVERSLFYEIRLVTADGSLVWEGRAEVTHARLPAEIRLAGGQKYFVWVRAYLSEGKTLKSPTVGFTVMETN